MAHQQSDQAYFGYNHSQLPPQQYGNQLNAAAPNQLHRVPSFDSGDDATFFDSSNGRESIDFSVGNGGAPVNGGYAINSAPGRQTDELFMGGTSSYAPPQPNRTSSYGPGIPSYQQQYQAQPSHQTAQGYNPQQFGRTPSQYNPQAYGTVNAGHGASHQPYNPAAYQGTIVSRHTSYSSPSNTYTPGVYGSSAPYTSPQLGSHLPLTPPLPQGQQTYFSRTQSQYNRPTSQYASYQPQPHVQFSPTLPQQSSSVPPLGRTNVYTPPAPPPPPFPPHNGTFLADDYRDSIISTSSAQQTCVSTSQPQQPSSMPAGHQHLPSVPIRVDPESPSLHTNAMTRYSSTSSHGEQPINPLPSPPAHSPRRTSTAGDYPRGRPLPGPPPPVDESDEEYIDGLIGNGSSHRGSADDLAREIIWKEVEAAIDSIGPGTSSARPSTRPEITYQTAIDEEGEPAPLFADGRLHGSGVPDNNTNGHLSATGTGSYVNYGAYSDESDAEAAAGLEAMRMAEEQDAADNARRQSEESSSTATYGQSLHVPRGPEEPSSDSDYGNVDMGLYGGGYGASISYGGDSYANADSQWHSSEMEDQSRPLPTPGSIRRTAGPATGARSDSEASKYDYSIPDQDTIHPFPSFSSNARVDTFGTGGLSEPSPHRRRLSFDEGDEGPWDSQAPKQRSGSQSPQKNREAEEFPELFYHPAPSSGPQRPLPSVPQVSTNHAPQLMAAGVYQGNAQYQNAYPLPGQAGLNAYPTGLDSPANRGLLNPAPQVPRSSSLSSHSSTPQTVPPVRSKTDAEERKLRMLRQQTGIRPGAPGPDIGYDSPTAPSSTVALDLPAIPLGKRKRFTPAKLSTVDFKLCEEPWALSSIARWVKDMSEGETDLKKKTIVDGIVALFTHKVPTMNTADAETLGERVVKDMLDAGVLIEEEEWVKIRDIGMSGVIWQLTGRGCYAPILHSTEMTGRCYSHHCSRTLKKINLELNAPQRTQEDWQTFYKVKKEDIEGVNKKEVHRQNILHEIVQSEETYLGNLHILMVLYRDQLHSWQPPIINPKRIDAFIRDVFGKANAVKKVNEDFLLAQLKYRQQEQGPWIVGFSDIFREWIRKAKKAYIEYAASFPTATMLVRKEAERNILFRQFLDQARENELSRRLDWNTYLKAPITRLQHYSLLLFTVYKDMLQETEEKTNLNTAIEEIKAVTLECDARVDEVTKKVALIELGSKLTLRPGMERVELNLQHLGRELIFRGDLQRAGGNRFTWLETHAILFDHYLVLAKSVHQRDSGGGSKHESYDVSKLPIPMDLLVLESTNDDPVVKSTVRGIGPVRAAAQPPAERSQTAPGNLTHTATSTSLSSVSTASSTKTMVASTVIDGAKDEKIMYPFRIKHLGKSEVYTLFALTAQNRQDWCDKILEAKTKHAASLFSQNAEPFRLRVMADTAFGSEVHASSAKTIIIKGTPLDRSIQEVEKMFENSGPRPGIVCRAAVNCATAFHQPYGKQMVAIGTEYGVYISDIQNPRGWKRAIQVSKVSQIAVLEEFSLFLVLSDKALTAYHLDIVCPVSGVPQPNDSARRAPQKLSGTRDVGFFATGRMKDRALVFYKKRDGISSTFKACPRVLEPVFQKSTERKSRFSRKGTTEFFREYDEFYIPTECFGINLFHSSLAISTARGFEVLTLDKKQPWSVPDLKQPHVVTISGRLSGQKPLGMFRLSDTEFLLCYEECAVYVNKHGDVSRSVIMEFVGKAKSAAMYGPYIILFDSDFVEVRNAQNGRLRQVIAGRDVRCLDDAQSGGSAMARTVKVALQHPESDGRQIVVELLLNEGQMD